MPFKYYHGRTAQVFNVNPRSIGITLKKKVGCRFIEKRLHVRVEHLVKSNVREAFKARVKESDRLKCEANKKK
jgi:large subunit ribosomal protein L21e